MIHHRTLRQVRWYDLFKAGVLILLFTLLFGLIFLRPAANTSASNPTAQLNETDVQPAPSTNKQPSVGETGVENPADGQNAAPVTVTPPSLDLAALDENLTPGEIALTGTGTPGAAVEILVNGEAVGTAPVGDDGTWNFTYSFADLGEYRLELRALDSNGGIAAESEPIVLKVVPPLAGIPPAIDLPGLEKVLQTGEFSLSGTGEPGNTVEILVDGEAAGSVVVGEDGTWIFPYPFQQAGEYQITVRSIDENGGKLAESEPVTLIFASPAVKPVITSPLDGDSLTGDQITLAGVGEPGSVIEILEDGSVIGTTVVDKTGAWQFNAMPDMAGTHVYVVRLPGEENSTSEPVVANLTPQTPVASAGNTAPCTFGQDKGRVWIVGGCDTLTRISERTGLPLEQILSSNPGITNPDLILPGQEIKLPRR